MIILVVITLVLLGATTWSALQQSLARDPVRHRRLTGVGLIASLAAIVTLVTVGLVIHP